MALPWIVLAIEAFISWVFSDLISEYNVAFCIVIIGLNCVALILGLAREADNREMAFILWIGLAFRLALLIWDLNFRYIYVLPNSGADTETYANAAKNGLLYGDYGIGGVYSRIIAFTYMLFGIQRPIAQYLNVLSGMTIIMVCLKIARYLSLNEITKKEIVILLCFLPNFAITNSILLRETFIALLISLSVYYFFVYMCQGSGRGLLISIILVCLASTLHSGAIAILLGEAVIICLYDKENSTIRINQRTVWNVLIVIIGFVVLYQLFGDTVFSRFQGIDSISDLSKTANSRNSGGSSYDAGFTINNDILSLIINTPIRMVYFVASPLPWKWRGLSDIIAFVFSAMVYIYTYYLAYNEIRSGCYDERRSYVIELSILCLCSALVFAWGVSNSGTAVRHREKFISVYIILLALCRDQRRTRLQNNNNNVEGV